MLHVFVIMISNMLQTVLLPLGDRLISNSATANKLLFNSYLNGNVASLFLTFLPLTRLLARISKLGA